ncbi:Nif3-like dinuclear metal center hexameric protein [Paenibacillus septentrionalis]|uniref:GTP cyclohydrolase 1 type 2 homolog n=1 Tax=Paenibacillus septentrionalis TaxID=429342 RepID=A0ABW1V1U3_9BACL
MAIHGQTLIQYMEQFAPKHYAVEHDRIGLQLGTLNKKIDRVLVTLDVTLEVVQEAIEKSIDLIIAHHAIIFRPIGSIDVSTPAGKLYELLIKHDIAVYISHTNLDVAIGGVNDLLADLAGMEQDRKPLDTVYVDQLSKLVVYVPESALTAVEQAAWRAGAGHIGNYSHCSFQSSGTGTFMAEAGATPFVGELNSLHREPEIRFECIVPASLQRKVVSSIVKAHPYEEVAYDLIPLQQQGVHYGLGRVGRLLEPTTLGQLAQQLKHAYNVPALRVVGDMQKPIKKIAVLGGMGAKYVKSAKFAGADVLITGDIDFHTAQDALADGMCIIDPGHHIEKVMIEGVKDWLTDKCKAEKASVEIIGSEVHTEPFTFL